MQCNWLEKTQLLEFSKGTFHYVNPKFFSIRQKGPTCGIVAFMMAYFHFNPTDNTDETVQAMVCPCIYCAHLIT